MNSLEKESTQNIESILNNDAKKALENKIQIMSKKLKEQGQLLEQIKKQNEGFEEHLEERKKVFE